MDKLESLYSFDDNDDDKFEAECPKSYEEGDRLPCFTDVKCDDFLKKFDKDNLCKITEYNDDSGQMETTKYCCAEKLADCCIPDAVPATLVSIGLFSCIVFALGLIMKYGKREPKNKPPHSKVDFLNEPLVEGRESSTGFE